MRPFYFDAANFQNLHLTTVGATAQLLLSSQRLWRQTFIVFAAIVKSKDNELCLLRKESDIYKTSVSEETRERQLAMEEREKEISALKIKIETTEVEVTVSLVDFYRNR